MMMKALANILTDRPEDPVDYFRQKLGASLKEKSQIELLNRKIDKYVLRIEELEKQLAEAQAIKKEPIDTADKSCQENDAGLSTSIKSESEIKVEPEDEDSNAENPDPENIEFSSAVDTEEQPEEQHDNEAKPDDFSDQGETEEPSTNATTAVTESVVVTTATSTATAADNVAEHS